MADHLREYIADMQDEAHWDDLLARTEDKLVAAARRTKQEIAEGKSILIDC